MEREWNFQWKGKGVSHIKWGNLLSRQVSSALQGHYINGKDIWSNVPSNRTYRGRRLEFCMQGSSNNALQWIGVLYSYGLKSHQRFLIRKDGKQWKLEPGGVLKKFGKN